MATASMFGWNLLYKTIEKDLTKKSDVIVAIVHWSLVKNLGFQCIGLGEDKTLSVDEKGDELLPGGWNSEEKSYSLRYRLNDKLFILLGTITEESIILNILDVSTLQVTNAAFDIENTVKALNGPIEQLIPNNSIVLDRIEKELLKDITNSSSVQTQTAPTSSEHPHAEDFRTYPPVPAPRNRDDQSRRDFDESVRNIGRGDLDPFHRGPGMLFNPPGLNFQPPGLVYPDGRRPNVPPGARFDPFGPPNPTNLSRMGPDNDHFRPPGFNNDDMFM